MTTDGWMRASDHDRENAVEVISEAYAVGRLSRDELDRRTGAAFSARTWGELGDLTADLPAAPAGAGLPASIVASRGMPRRDVWRLIAQMQWIFVLALAAGLAGLVIPVAVWLGVFLVPLELLLLHALGVWSRGKRGGISPPERITFTSRYDVSSACGMDTPPIPEVVRVTHYKYQALVTLYPGSGVPDGQLDSSPRRAVVRCRNGKSGHSRVFTALVSCNDNEPFRPGNPQVLAALQLAVDDVADCLNTGSRFSLWVGEDVGEGIITGRLFT